MFKQFVSEYGFQILFALLTAIAGFIGTQIKRIYETKVNDERKKKIVEQGVKAVEQMYKNLDGDEKFHKATDYICERLNQEGIYWTDLEIEMLVESCVAEFNKPWIKIHTEEITNG